MKTRVQLPEGEQYGGGKVLWTGDLPFVQFVHQNFRLVICGESWRLTQVALEINEEGDYEQVLYALPRSHRSGSQGR